MPFVKGQPKIGGKTKGTKNRKTEEAIQRVEFVLSLLEETLESDIEGLNPKDRVLLWNDLQEFVRPKLSRTEIKQDGVSELVIRVIEEDGRDQ